MDNFLNLALCFKDVCTISPNSFWFSILKYKNLGIATSYISVNTTEFFEKPSF